MGHEIVYCFNCQIRLAGSDFERGKAFRVDGQAACPGCVRGLLADHPDPEGELERLKKLQALKGQAAAASPNRGSGVHLTLPESSTRRIHIVPHADSDSTSWVGVTLAVGGGAVLVLVAAVFFSSSSGRSETPLRPDTKIPPAAIIPAPDRPLRPPSGASPELEELDARMQASLREKKFAETAKILAEARSRHSTAEWNRALEERTEKFEASLRPLTGPLLDAVGPAVRKGDDAALRSLRRQLEAFGGPAILPAFEKAIEDARKDPWVVLSLSHLASEGGATFAARRDGSVLVGGNNPERDTFSAVATLGFRQVRAFRIEALPDPSLGGGGPGRTVHGNFVLTELRVLAAGRSLSFAGSSSDFEQDSFPSSAAIDGNPRTGWGVMPRFGQASSATFQLQVPVDLEEAALVLEFQSAFGQHALGCFRISATSVEIPAPPAPRPADATPLPAPKDASPELSAEAKAWKKAWKKAARLASGRDFAGAIKILEESRRSTQDSSLRKDLEEDLANFRQASELLAELPQLLGRWTPGARIKLDYIVSDGMTDLAEGVLVEASPRSIVLQTETGSVEIPPAELGAATVAALAGLRGEKRPGDAKAVALLSASERRPLANLPPRYASLKSGPETREREARSIFWKAQSDFSAMKTRGAAGAAYAALLEKYGQTSFVLRNRPLIEDRLQAARDFVFMADELSAGGHFAPVATPKADPTWLSAADSPAGKAAENYVEAEVSIEAGAAYRGWVYAGGCCQEVFTCFLQGTGLSGPSARNPKETVTAQPGGEEWIALRPPGSGLKKKHAEHGGPKQPERWMWIDLGVLKFAEPGMKKLRILSEEKGFSLQYLAVSATRQGPPREQELRELSRSRPPQIFEGALRELWRGIAGVNVSELLASPKFAEGLPDESGPVTSIDSSNLGTNYGCRIRGYLHPPATGDYTFWIASDDGGELWVSPDEHPSRKKKVCGLFHFVGPQEWNADPSQKSAPVKLVAGQRYYFEVLHKQGEGPEHVSVGWQLPGGALERPIPGTRLSPAGAFPPRKPVRPHVRPLPLAGAVTRSAYLGGSGGLEFEDLPEPRKLLRGFRYSISASGCLFSLQPLYEDAEGHRVGGADPSGQIVARPGFAVGGIVGRGTDRLNAFKVIFMRDSAGHLDSSDRYESDWIGTRQGGEETILGATGKPVIGIFGRAAWEVDGAGLLLSGK